MRIAGCLGEMRQRIDQAKRYGKPLARLEAALFTNCAMYTVHVLISEKSQNSR